MTFNLNCSDTIFVGGDFIQEAGTLNLGNSTRSVVLSIQQTINQNTGGIITETGSGTQTILINGGGLQLVTFKGTIINQVAMVKDGTGLASFKAPVSLPFKLTLKNGRILTSQGLITLTAACTISADTLSGNAFIDGPLKKDGLSNQSFLFPVGKSGAMRWVQLQNATGNFTLEYFRTDPHTLSGSSGPGINHFSKVEYWDVTTSVGATSKIKLSFVLPGSGMVTDLSKLRVARLINGTWEDAGNVSVAGAPGSDGWVSSIAASGFSANSKSFALASASGQENPLPISSLQLRAETRNDLIRFSWIANPDIPINKFYLQRSDDGITFTTVQVLDAEKTINFFRTSGISNGYYKLVAVSVHQVMYTSNVLYLRNALESGVTISGSNVVSDQLILSNRKRESITFHVIDAAGRNVKMFSDKANSVHIKLNVSDLVAGCYFLRSVNSYGRGKTFRFIKL